MAAASEGTTADPWPASGQPSVAPVGADHSAPDPAPVDRLDGIQRLSTRVLLFWGLPWAILTVVVLAVVVAVVLAGDGSTAGAVIAVAVTLGLGGLATVLFPRMRYRRWWYRVTEDRLELGHGVLVRAESSVPHFRVQHIDLRQGPLQRLAGVVDLQISTASAASDATLPGVEPERAEQIRALVLARAEADDAV